jgi:MFS family permease
LSDRLRRRKWWIIAGYGLASLVRPLLALSGAAWQVLALRFTDRVGKGLRSAPRDALIADSVAAEQRGLAFGFHRAADHAGALVGALAAAGLMALFSNDYRRVFWAAAVPALVAVLILLLAVQEPSPSPVTNHPVPSPTKTAPHFDPAFKQYLAVLLCFTLGNSSDAFLLLRARASGISATTIPLLWAALHMSKSLSSILGGGLSDRLGRRKLIVSGWVIYALIYAGFAFATTPAMMWLLFPVYGLYFGLTEGVEKALVADLAGAEQRGTAFGWYNLVIGLGALPASLLTGLLWEQFGAAVALLTGAGLSLLAAFWLSVSAVGRY